jgi:hypothetical protein
MKNDDPREMSDEGSFLQTKKTELKNGGRKEKQRHKHPRYFAERINRTKNFVLNEKAPHQHDTSIKNN